MIEIGDVFLVDAVTGGGIVLDLNGEVTADSFDKDFILDRDVWMLAGALHVAMGAFPIELLLRGEFVFVVEAVTLVF